MENERAVIGGNRTPFEIINDEINDLYDEAKQWLDGEPVISQDQADALNALLSRISQAATKAEDERKREAKPFDDGKRDVQARYNPLIAEGKGKASMAKSAVKSALQPFLLALELEQQEKARIARQEADRIQAEAQAALRASDAANLAEREAAEKQIEQGKKAEREAAKAENAKAHAKADGFRATGLRTVKSAVMVDQSLAAAWVWKERRAELLVFIQDQADKALRSGAHQIQGFEIKEEKKL